VLRKETAFPLWRAVERNVVSLLSSVINIVIIIIFDHGTQFPANEKITPCNTEKYKNQAGINLTPPSPYSYYYYYYYYF